MVVGQHPRGDRLLQVSVAARGARFRFRPPLAVGGVGDDRRRARGDVRLQPARELQPVVEAWSWMSSRMALGVQSSGSPAPAPASTPTSRLEPLGLEYPLHQREAGRVVVDDQDGLHRALTVDGDVIVRAIPP